MLEIKHVSKTYRPKKGVPVKALDDVSLKFEDRGMVFILGKSGSGKSTLLNVLGGLDKADEGEFIIKGKSSNNFSQSDFDSYRNTFIGFIFQEYNILSEFTVGANIALAMELQGKKATNEALNDILEQVDLTGYGNRKPNELSGGQKQRVAIARALIKQPEMIMADEPTGALDSNTGKQVFDTLKKLSEKKLVLIVSHDRDFAELYADRIIELKDGKVISDVSKTSLPPQAVSEGVSVVDDKIIHVKRGYKLTSADLKLINDYIERADCDTLISVDGGKNNEIKKAIKLNDEGGKDEFKDTRESELKQKNYTAEESKLIRSRLPYKNSLKIGASSLKSKPVRLVFTIFLCMVAFSLFGLADTMGAYDKYKTFERSIIDGNIKSAVFQKNYEMGEDYKYYNTALLGESDLEKIEKGAGISVLPVYTGDDSYNLGLDFSNSIEDSSKISGGGYNYYQKKVTGFIEADETVLQAWGVTLEEGSSIPQNSGEIIIPTYVYEHFALAGLRYTNPSNGDSVVLEAEAIESPADLIGHYIEFGRSKIYKICGVMRTNFDSSPYEAFKPGSAQGGDEGFMDMIKYSELQNKLTYGFHSLCVVSKGALKDMMESSNVASNNVIGLDINKIGNMYLQSGDFGQSYSYVAKLSQFSDKNAITWLDGPRTTLAKGEIILPYDYNIYNYNTGENLGERNISSKTQEYLEQQFSGSDFDQISIREAVSRTVDYSIRKYVDGLTVFPSGTFDDAVRKFFGYLQDVPLEDSDRREFYLYYLANNNLEQNAEYPQGGFISNAFGGLSGLEISNPHVQQIYKFENVGAGISETGTMDKYHNYSESETGSYKVVGYYVPTAENVNNSDSPYMSYDSFCKIAIISDEDYDYYGSAEPGIYGLALGVMPDSGSGVEKVVEFNYTVHSDKSVYFLKNEASFYIDSINDLIETLAQVFLYIGLFFAVFAALMMFNFISVSISYKKREIGILRAVGARSSDVFGIFFNESLIITLINFVLSSIVTVAVVIVINGVLRNQYGFALTVLNLGIRQFALILGVGVAVAFIASFLPVMRISRKRPIDAIQNR